MAYAEEELSLAEYSTFNGFLPMILNIKALLLTSFIITFIL
jgi:hypothetical protein